MTDEDLYQALQLQLENLIVKAFEWQEGTFHFVDGTLPAEEEIKLELDTANVILTLRKTTTTLESQKKVSA